MSDFKVVINTMTESEKGESYVVTLYHPDRPEDALPWDDGKMEIYHTYDKDRAEATLLDWQEFLNYEQRTFGFSKEK